MTSTKDHHDSVEHDHAGRKTNITAEELTALPLKAFSGKVQVVTDPANFAKVAQELSRHPVIGFDTETRPSFTKGQSYRVALLQLAIPQKVFLIRLHQTGINDDIISIFENPDIIKAGVAIRDDIKALQKIKRFHPNAFVELATMSKEAGLQVESVKKLTGLLLGFRISKNAQTSNWEALTLTEKQIEYAATDAWVCLEVYKKLNGAEKKKSQKSGVRSQETEDKSKEQEG
jgi:ribonuclease D